MAGEIRDKMLNWSAWGGPLPIWIQNPAPVANFVMQFDRLFIPGNERLRTNPFDVDMGDNGTTYLFPETAFAQGY